MEYHLWTISIFNLYMGRVHVTSLLASAWIIQLELTTRTWECPFLTLSSFAIRPSILLGLENVRMSCITFVNLL